MPTDFEIDDFGNEKATYDGFNCDDFLKDHLDMDYVYDEDLFQKITNEIDIPLFDSDNILLRDATPNEIWSEATQFRNTSDCCQLLLYNNDLTNNNNNNTIIIKNPTAECTNGVHSIQYSSNGSVHENETNSINSDSHSHSPTPSLSGSSDSSERGDPSNVYNVNAINLNQTAPPVPAVATTTMLTNTNQSILFNNNGEVYQMISFKPPTTDVITNNNSITSTNTLKIPINTKYKNAHVKSAVKRNVLFPKSTFKASSALNGGNQLYTTTTIPTLSPPNTTDTSTPPLVMNGSDYDPKLLKRMQRMIKNRESASMSRKRKKDYVVSLEKQCEQLSTENRKLRMENNSLKQIVSGLNMNCKSTVFSFNNISSKNTAILLGMLLMVSINIGSLRNLLFKDITNEDLTRSSSSSSIVDYDFNDFHTRHLLNVPSSGSKSESGLLMNDDTQVKPKLKTKSTSTTFTNNSCHPFNSVPTTSSSVMNQTESIRLASELRKLIGDPYPFYYNITHAYQRRSSSNIIFKSRSHPSLRSSNYQFKRNTRYANENQIKSKLNKLYSLSRRNRRTTTTTTTTSATDDLQIYSFGPHLDYTRFFDRINLRDDTFYVISLRADHMLIPAINHNKTARPKMSLLMPAAAVHSQQQQHHSSHQNESYSTPNNHITLMKIDCEVFNTNLVHVNRNSIPQHLRESFIQIKNETNNHHHHNNNNNNTTTDTESMDLTNIHINDLLNATTNITMTRKSKRIRNRNRLYKPYFIRTADGDDDDDDLALKTFGLFP